jgi:2-haloacid dehalogenase
MHEVKALFFDVFGTLVDWRSSIAREAREILSPCDVALDWESFADAWRDQYQPAMDEVRTGRLPFSKLDALHRRNLDVILRDLGLDRIDEPTRARLNLAWHRLDAWPDVASGPVSDRPLLERKHFVDGRPRPAKRVGVGCDSRR